MGVNRPRPGKNSLVRGRETSSAHLVTLRDGRLLNLPGPCCNMVTRPHISQHEPMQGANVSGFHQPLKSENSVAVTTWTKSSLSHVNGNCVQIANLSDGQVGMRDSKDVSGAVLGIPSTEWKAFLGGIKNGEFDFHSVYSGPPRLP